VQYTKKLDNIEKYLGANQDLCNSIVRAGLKFYDIPQSELDEFIHDAEKNGRKADRTSVSQAIKHFARDWSVGGEQERDDAFPCIKTELVKLFPERSTVDVKVLLPGSGLGRLGHEVAGLGGELELWCYHC
jgi:hypothetical protein